MNCHLAPCCGGFSQAILLAVVRLLVVAVNERLSLSCNQHNQCVSMMPQFVYGLDTSIVVMILPRVGRILESQSRSQHSRNKAL